ncbi:TPA_asm: M [Dryobalanops betacytorhabdovirus 1]|nr:TPA_asm: M [Dryobalanops betacytorhabdovirus 1]
MSEQQEGLIITSKDPKRKSGLYAIPEKEKGTSSEVMIESFTPSDKLVFYMSDKIKVNYCALYSTISGTIYGRSKEELIVNYPTVLENAIRKYYQDNFSHEVDKEFEIFLMNDNLLNVLENKKVGDIILKHGDHFLLGSDTYKLTIDIPPISLLRVKYPIRFNTKRSFDMNYSVAEDNKFQYEINLSGDISYWGIPDDVVRRTFKDTPSYFRQGTVMNIPTDNILNGDLKAFQENRKKILLEEKRKKESKERLLKHLTSDDEKIVREMFNEWNI